MRIGVDYYPEQWDKALWEKDADLMAESGVKLVRMAEFAWSRLEPKEGQYDFTWLDEAVSLFAQRDIQVILCTPTCTPPLWLFGKYPEVIQVDKSGHRISIGIRGHRCLNSPVFRTLSERIIRRMVERYVDEPAVIGYQIDNELEANHCCCPVCQDKFRSWMRDKYGTVENVNHAYGNTVWSGEYSDFSQVMPPMGPYQKWLNPSLTLDFNRYASDSTVEYVCFQADLIRSMDGKAMITTNNWLCENMPDFYQMFQGLDFVSYDNYPAVVLPEDQESLYSHAFHLDLMRGIKQKNFWIMEQLSGPVGSWSPMSPTLRPGMLKGYSLQAIAHGAEEVIHFRWRSAVSGAEMYWHGLIDQSNVPGRRFAEFQELCREVNSLSELEGSVIKNRVALLYSARQEYAFKLQHQAEGMYYLEHLKQLHDGFTCIGVGVDIISEDAGLEDYDVVLAPNLMIVDETVTDKLYRFVEQGGSLVLTCRCGVKDVFNKCIMAPLPTVFQKLSGVHVTEYDAIGNSSVSLEIMEDSFLDEYQSTARQTGKNLSGRSWCDLLETDTAHALLCYAEGFYQNTPAVTENSYGKGTVHYLGTLLSRGLYITLAKRIARLQAIPYYENLPLGVEICTRQKEKQEWKFLFNNTEKAVEFEWEGENISLQPFQMVIASSPK